MTENNSYAFYVRVSTRKQDSGAESQLSSVKNWLEDNAIENYDEYVDLYQSGADQNREQFSELYEKVEQGQYTDIVVPEISRMARDFSYSLDFIELCVEKNVTVHLLQDMMDTIDPDDPSSQFMAKMIGLLMEEDRKHRIRQINRGVQHAQEQGKWTGRTPVGFTTNDEGYLIVELEEYLAFRDALKRVLEGESQRSVERDTRFTRTTIASVLEDDQRKEWYLEADTTPENAEDENEERQQRLVKEALEEADIEPAEYTDDEESKEELTNAIVQALEQTTQ